MTILAPKRSTDSATYVFGWDEQLAPTGDTIVSYVLTVITGTVTVPTASQSFTSTSVTALIVGGANGETATLQLVVTTAGGQVLTRDLTIRIADTSAAIWPSTTTKRQLAEMAFEEIGLAGYEFDATAEEYATTLRRLDALMAEWRGPGMNLDLGYAFPAAIGGSDLADVSGIPDFAANTVAIMLAMRIMPAIGKTMSGETKAALMAGMSALLSVKAIPERTLPPSTLRGAGNKPRSTWAPYNGNWQ